MRQIFLDTETSGFEYKDGHRIIEFGAIEAVNRKLTGNQLHLYFKPDIEVEKEAFEVHGLSNDRLKDEPLFEEKVDEIMTFLEGAELVIHNAAFDESFIDYELGRIKDSKWKKLSKYCQVTDTLLMARKKHPGQRNSLDALCKRYMVSNAHRTLHGALLDAELLAHVYFAMTGGQTNLAFQSETDKKALEQSNEAQSTTYNLRTLKLSDDSAKLHEKYLDLLEKKSKNGVLWKKIDQS